ncbi:MAG: hypothetical protein GY826_28525, partial [Fuerstiella sp.]|nr:hypothetical protein [Fuerstiella sp.]
SISTVALVQADGQEVVRGNRFTNRVNSLTQQQKIGLGLLVAAAVIIPIAVNDDGS